MKIIILFMSAMMSILFSQMNHPMAMGLILLIQTMLIGILTGMISQSFWFSYTLFLIFLGGMLIIFIYITSFASNEMFSFSMPTFIILLISFPFMYFLKEDWFHWLYSNQETLNFLLINNSLNNNLIKLYNMPTNMITILLITYLFLTLIVIVKIIHISMGPLRQMN